MSETVPSQPPHVEVPVSEPGEPLQFDRAEFETPASDVPGCAVCKQPISEEYYEINGRLMCPRCRHGVEAAFRGGSPIGRFFVATAYGGAAAVAGAIVYYASIRATNWNLALVSILVGFLVGKAVRQGTGNRGGLLYQFLAVVLTYCSLVAMNVLLEIQEVSLRACVQGMVDRFSSPLTEGFARPITGLIYAFAVWEAWKLNKSVELTFNGPFRVGAAGPASLRPEGVDDGV